MFYYIKIRPARVLFFLLFSAVAALSSAQNTPPETYAIHAKAANMETKNVYLRWAPANYVTWRYGIEHGYTVRRKTLAVNGQELKYDQQEASVVLLADGLMPLPEANWETLSETNDAAGVAASCIYGDSLDVMAPTGANLMAMYNATRERDTRFGFGLFAADRDFEVAQLMGLGLKNEINFTDDYLYTIELTGLPSTAATSIGYVRVSGSEALALPALDGLEALPGDHAALLVWNRNDAFYSAYRVLRSPTGANDWTDRTPTPLVYTAEPGVRGNTVFFRDSLPNNDQTFDYLIHGLSAFGPTEAALLPNVKGKPAPLEVSMAILGVNEANPGQLTLNWLFPAEKQGEITHFEVWRAINADSAYHKISLAPLSPSARTFTDNHPLPTNYYQVRTTDLNGYEITTPAALGQPKDETPPAAPIRLNGKCDKNGVVTLHWPRSPEADVMGYRVFTSNVKNADYGQVTSAWINDTAFQYSINLYTLSQDVYFGVKALDYRHNQSGMTIVKITRPDVIPPVAPILTKLTPQADGIRLEWTASPSTDVVRHELQRLKNGTSNWATLTSFEPQAPLSTYTDLSAERRTRYRYRLVAVDGADNRASSKLLEGMRFNNGLRDPLLSLTGQYNAGLKATVQLDWEYPLDKDLSGFVIYRALKDTNSWRSHAFFTYPLALQSNAPGSPHTVTGPHSVQCTWYDADVDFNLIYKQTHLAGNTTFLNPNQSVPSPSPGPTGPTYTVPNGNYPGAGKPALVYYWVQAQFVDGSSSAMRGPVAVAVQ